MERRTRVYPAERLGSSWVSFALLLIAALLVVSGVIWRKQGDAITIEQLVSVTPIPMDEAFDETPARMEMTLPAGEWYALQLGAFENKEAAEALSEQFRRRGAAGYVWTDERFRVLAAVYPLKEDAQLVREQLQLRHEIETYLYQIRLPEIRISLSGMQGQLDILQASLVHAQDLLNSLQQMSMEMDRQELTVQEALEKLNLLNEQVSLVALRLRQRFSSPRHELAQAFLACFEQHAAFCASLNEKMSQVSLGTQLKHQTFATLHAIQTVYDTLSHT